MRLSLSFPFKVFAWCYAAMWGCVVLFGMLLKKLLRPGSCGFRQDRPYPKQLRDEKWGTHHTAVVNGVSLHYVEAGAPDAPIILLLHGFPECWWSWRHSLRALSDEYRVIALDMRGFGESSKPGASWWTASKFYNTAAVTADVASFVTEHLGAEEVNLCAHDWGSAIGFRLVQEYPDLVRKYLMVNGTHPVPLVNALTTKQLFASWYVYLYQLPWLPEWGLGDGDGGALHGIFRKKPMGLRLSKMADDDLDVYKYYLGQPGAATAPLNYYRAFFGSISDFDYDAHPPKCDLRVVWGTEDAALGYHLVEALPRFFPEFDPQRDVVKVEGASHWIQMEAPDIVNQEMRRFFDE